MCTNYTKPPKYMDMLLTFIQKLDYKSTEGLLTQNPNVANEKMEDGLEPIFFCIRNKCNKAFVILLKKMTFDEELIKKVYTEIKKEGTPKMLKIFLEYFKISFDDSCLDEKDKEMLEQLNNKKKKICDN